jgi:hypothetical protein
MMRTDSRLSRSLRAVASWGLIAALGALGAYGVWTVRRANQLYDFLKDSGRGWTRRVFRPDAELGFAPIPNAVGGDMLPYGPPVPSRFDQDGFRVPAEGAAERHRPLVLALGCSFTYGAACPAEAAYPHLVAQALGGSALNAGTPSYGLGQMLILARRLIPRHAPDYVLVQYSQHLVTRAQSGTARSFFGALPTPMFVSQGEGVRLEPPSFRSWALELPLGDVRDTPRSASDYTWFLFRAGLPLMIHDDLALGLAGAKRRLGLAPGEPADADRIVASVYTEIAALSRAAGSRMRIVLLGRNPAPERVAELRRHAVVVDAELALCRAVDTQCPYTFPYLSQAYLEAYGHFRGSPPVFVDSHPNPRAHALIAAEVTASLRTEPDRASP